VTWSPDSTKIALPRRDDTTEGDIWILSLKDGAMARLTDEPGYETNAFWLTDGKSMVYDQGQRFGSIDAVMGGTESSEMEVGGCLLSPTKWL
jgi:Tol biopolymer transport system component